MNFASYSLFLAVVLWSAVAYHARNAKPNYDTSKDHRSQWPQESTPSEISSTASQVKSQTVIVTNKVWIPFTDRPANFERIDANEACEAVTPGIRFWKKGDPTLIRIEDNQGNFVGTQTGIYKSALLEVVPLKQQPDTVNWYENNAQVQVEKIDGQTTYLMTGYIYDPSQICSGPQTNESTHLYIKHNGCGAIDGYLNVCRSDRSVEDAGWNLNPCVPTMGDHYRYKVPAVNDPDCTDWTPSFLLFDGMKNVGYGWNYPANIPTINFEHAPRDKFTGVIIPMPGCILKSFDVNKGYSSQHVYLVDNPQGLKCQSL